MNKKCLMLLFATGFWSSMLPLAFAQTANSENTLTAGEGFESPDASIDDLEWIAGHWHGEAMGGTFEETWNPPMGGAMVGVFKFVQGEQPGFYEILTIVPMDNSLTLRLKHFDNQLHGWEEKDETVEFRLIKSSDNEANFDGLTFRRISPNEMHIFVVVGHDEGQSEEIRFECHRSAEPAMATETSQRRPSETRTAMLRVVEIDRVLAHQRDHMCESMPLADSVSFYVDGLGEIDFSSTPDEFAEAYRDHQQAWTDSIAFLKQHDQLRGEMHALFEDMSQMDEPVVQQLNRHIQEIADTWSSVETAMSRFP